MAGTMPQPEELRPSRIRRSVRLGPRSLAVGIAITLVLMGSLGLIVANRERVQVLHEWTDRLDAMADDRRWAVEHWVADGLADARVFATRDEPITMLLHPREGAHLAAGLVESFTLLEQAHHYHAALLVSPSGRIIVRTPGVPESPCQRTVLAAIEAGPISAFVRREDGSAVVCFGAPVTAGGRIVGALGFSADPAASLYPLFSHLAFFTKTAETILIARDGDRAVFLSPLRQLPGAPLTHFRPLSDPGFVGRTVLRGQEVSGEFTDYVGRPIYLSARPIRNTPWALVVKVDREEVTGDVWRRLLGFGVLLAVVSLSLLLSGLWFWRTQWTALHLRAAQESAKRLQEILEQMPAMLAAMDDRGRMVAWNTESERVTGYSRTAMLEAADPYALLYPDPEYRRRMVAESRRRGRDYRNWEWELTRPDGTTRQVAWSNFAARHPIPGWSDWGIGIDLTELHQAQQELRDSELLHRLMFESNPHPMYMIDDETYRFLAVNEAAVRDYGYSREEFLGMTVLDIRPEEEVPGTLEVLAQAADKPMWVGVRRHRTRTGEIIHVEVTANRLHVAGRRLAVVLAQNVTDRLRAEARLARLNEAVLQAGEAIFITDLQGNIVYVNPAFEQITGYTSEEALGRTPSLFKSGEHDPAFYAEMWAQLIAGKTWSGAIRNRRKDGTIFAATEIISPVRDVAGKTVSYIGLQRDVTHEVALADQLRQAQKMQAVGQLTGGIAHDFNNMLAVILSNAELLREELPPTGTGALDFLEELTCAAHRTAELVRKLLAFARQEHLELRYLELATVLPELHRTLTQLLPETIALRVEIPPDLPPILGDRGAIEQILLNLAINARDAMPEGGTLTFRVETGEVEIADPRPGNRWESVSRGPTVQIEVSDTGEGMAASVLQRIFEPFYTTKDPGRGTGLGMAMVYGLMKQHNGFVNVYSAPGQGTTVQLHFPVAQLERESPAEGLAGIPSGARGHETLLLAEDEPSLRASTVRVLERMGYRVLAAADGEDALRVFEQHEREIALIVTDVMMPRLSGAGVWRALRARGVQIPFLFVTGYSSTVIAPEVLADPRVNYLAKPWSVQELSRLVQRGLHQSAKA